MLAALITVVLLQLDRRSRDAAPTAPGHRVDKHSLSSSNVTVDDAGRGTDHKPPAVWEVSGEVPPPDLFEPQPWRDPWRDYVDPLTWLANHQSDDGLWHARDFTLRDDWIGPPDADLNPLAATYAEPYRGKPEDTLLTTALALYAFTLRCYTHHDNRYAEHIKRAMRALKSRQVPDGALRGAFADESCVDWLRDQAACVWAIADAYSMTGSSVLKRVAERGLEHLELLIDWARRGKAPASMEALVWAPLALRTCDFARLAVNDDAWGALDELVLTVTSDEETRTLLRFADGGVNTTNVATYDVALTLLDRYPVESVVDPDFGSLRAWLLKLAAASINHCEYVWGVDDAFFARMRQSPLPQLAGSWDPVASDRARGRCYATAFYAVLSYTGACGFCFTGPPYLAYRH